MSRSICVFITVGAALVGLISSRSITSPAEAPLEPADRMARAGVTAREVEAVDRAIVRERYDLFGAVEIYFRARAALV